MTGIPHPPWDGTRLSRLGASPPPDDVRDLIETAKRHEFGLEYLTRGAHDSVAATFGVHAFLVDAARDHLLQDDPAPR